MPGRFICPEQIKRQGVPARCAASGGEKGACEMGVKKPVLCLFEVSHPEFPTVVVTAVGADSATVAACKAWGVPDEWGYLAGYCTVKKGGPAQKPRCRRCHKEFGEPGGVGAYCPDCEEVLERVRRETARVRTRDRRPGYRNHT